MKQYSKLALLLTLCLALLLPSMVSAESDPEKTAGENQVIQLPSLADYWDGSSMTIKLDMLSSYALQHFQDAQIVVKGYEKGQYVVRKDGKLAGERYLSIEGKYPIWAGIYDGTDQPPRPILQATTDLLPLEQATNNCVVDLSGVKDIFRKIDADNSEKLADLYVYFGDAAKMSDSVPCEYQIVSDTNVCIQARDKDRKNYIILWAGLVKAPAEGQRVRLTFSAYTMPDSMPVTEATTVEPSEEPSETSNETTIEEPSVLPTIDASSKEPTKEPKPVLTPTPEPTNVAVTLVDRPEIYSGAPVDLEPKELPEELKGTLTYAVKEIEDGLDPNLIEKPKTDEFKPAAEVPNVPVNVGKYRVFVKLTKSGYELQHEVVTFDTPTPAPSQEVTPTPAAVATADDTTVTSHVSGADAPGTETDDKSIELPDSKPSLAPLRAEAVPVRIDAFYDLTITKADVTFTLTAAQDEVPTYRPGDQSGQELKADVTVSDVSEDSIALVCKELAIAEEREELLKQLNAKVQEKDWPEVTATGTNAGTYPVNESASLQLYEATLDEVLGPNFKAKANWVDGNAPKLQITPLAANVDIAVLGNNVGVYHEGEALSFDSKAGIITPIERNADPIDNDIKLHIKINNNKLDHVGVLSAEDVQIDYTEDEVGQNVKNNYALTPRGENVLVMFPQSINDNDEKWDAVADTIVPSDYVGEHDKPLKAYWDGMTVELAEKASVYDGNSKAITPTFGDEQLKEGTDYSVLIRNAQTGEDVPGNNVIDAGKYSVMVTGMGNYGGEVELGYEVQKKPFDVSQANITVESCDYDGKPHGPIVTADELEYYKLSANGEPEGEPFHEAPIAAGRYSVKATWYGDKNSEGGESKEVRYEIRPIQLKIYLEAGGKIESIRRVADNAGTETEDEAAAGLFLAEAELSMSSELTEAQMDEGYQWPENFEVEVIPGEPEIRFENDNIWYYDGQKAGQGKHTIRTTPELNPETDSLVFYIDLGDGKRSPCSGEDADGPASAGDYLVAIKRVQENGGSTETPAIAFTIKPLEVTLSIEPKAPSIDFGNELPGYDIKVETTVDISDELRTEIENEWPVTVNYDGGVGSYSYSIDATAPGKSGNFELVDAQEATFVVEKQMLAVERVEVNGVPAEDVGKEIRDAAPEHGEPIDRGDIVVTDVNGETLEPGKDYNLYEPLAPDDTTWNELIVVANPDGKYDGVILLKLPKSWTQKLLTNGGMLWLVLAVVLLLGAAGCIVAAVQLSGRIKRDSLKLLDKVSRQSSRTIRRGR